MRTLSAVDAISPAIDLTKALLAQPFRPGRSWKLAMTAYLSAMGIAFVPIPLALLAIPNPGGTEGRTFTLMLALAGVASTAVLLAMFYLGSRLQFVLFGMVAERGQFVAPLWRKYRSGTWGWMGLKLALSLAVCALFGVPMYSAVKSLIPMFSNLQGQPPTPEFLGRFLLVYALILAPMLLLMLCSSLLSDFVLPSIALEGVSVGEALRRWMKLMKAEPGAMAVYLLMKIVLAIAAMMALQMATLAAEIVSGIVFGLIALAGWGVLHFAGTLGSPLMIAGAVLLGILFWLFVMYVVTGCMGAVYIFLQTYASYFLGGRYPLLGNMLPSLPPPLPPWRPPPPLPAGMASV
jgi:hypothetical protein